MEFIDTHAHLDGAEFQEDLSQVIERAHNAGAVKIFVPAIDLASTKAALTISHEHKGFLYPMVGLHPEEVNADFRATLDALEKLLIENLQDSPQDEQFIAIGEVGLDYYWSREFENEQLEAFERQVCWSIKHNLPLMIHCRKARNEMVAVLKKYKKQLLGGVFHCFSGNEREAEQLLQFENFALGIGGILTFKNSHLPEVVPYIPLNRIVLETDSPYMTPVPLRGKRNESACLVHIIQKLAQCYDESPELIAAKTTANVQRIFSHAF